MSNLVHGSWTPYAPEAELGRPLTAHYLYRLRSGRKSKPGSFPSYKTVHDRFGSWQRICELMDGRNAADS